MQAAKVITASIRVKNLLIFSFLSEIRCKVTTFFADTQTQIARIYTNFAETHKKRTRNVRFLRLGYGISAIF